MPALFPPPPNASLDPCEAIFALQASRPALPHVWSVLGAVCFALLVAIVVISVAGFYVLRDEPRLRLARSFGIHVLTCVVCVFNATVTGLRYTVWNLDTNATNVPCWITLFFLLLSGGSLAIIVMMRGFILYYQTRQSVLMKRLPSPEPISSSASSDNLSVMTSSPSWKARIMQSIYMSMKHLLFFKEEDNESVNGDLTEIGNTRAVLTGRGLALVTLFAHVPVLIVAFLFFASWPIYQTSCTGCDVYAPVVIGVFVESGVCSIFLIAVLLRIYQTKDSFGVKNELVIVVFGVIPLVLLEITLVLFDPSDLQLNYIMCWDWLAQFTLLPYMVVTAIPVFQAYQDRRRRLAMQVAHPNLAPTFETVTKALGDTELQAMCEKYYCLELLLFLKEVDIYAKTYFDHGDNWRKAKASALVAKYIDYNAPLELNLSADLRNRILARYRSAPTKPTADLFDEVIKEVIHLLRYPWGQLLLNRNRSVVPHNA